MTAIHSDLGTVREIELLRVLRRMVDSDQPRRHGTGTLGRGLIAGSTALPRYSLVTSWSALFRAWQQRAPELTDLLDLKRLLADLSRRRVLFEPASPDPASGPVIDSEPLIEVALLSSDPEGLEALGLQVWLNGYVDVVLDAGMRHGAAEA